ncbi:MAG: wax ester/triacylglycerol synthase family O-acyltransferase [Halioglobus sp.]
MKRLAGMDAMFLHTETATQYMHTLKVAIYDPPENGEPYSFQSQFEHIASTIHRVPPFRWKAVKVPFNVHNPVWINDSQFDLGLHVHRAALPAPAGDDELAEFIGNIASAPLNRDRPLWELWMVENYLGDKIAAVSKVHHALADGMATAELLEDFMTPEPGENEASPQPWLGESLPSPWSLFWSAVKDLVLDLAKIPGQIIEIRAAKKRQEARNLAPELRPPEPYTAPYTSLNQPISSHRQFSFFTVPLADVKQLSKSLGVTLNDVVLNMSAQAVRDFLVKRDELPPESLTASVPVSTREHEVVHTYGNKVGSLCVSLGTHIEEPLARLTAIHQSMESAKLDFEDTKGGRIADFIGLLPPVAVRAIGRYSRKLSEQGKSPSYSVIVSNVPGPRSAMFDDYMPMRQFYSIGPVLEGIGLNITAWSFRDNLSFSILSCHRAVPEPDEIKKSLLSALDQMKIAVDEANAQQTA